MNSHLEELKIGGRPMTKNEIKIQELEKEIKELKIQLRIKDEYFHLIWMIGCDYDGYETPEGLKGVIDELVAYANCGANNDDEYVKELLGGIDE